MGILGHLGVVGTKGRRNMHDTGTILSRHIVTGDYAESLTLHLHELVLAVFADEDFLRMSLSIRLHIVGGILVEFGRRLYPRHQLLILQAYELLTLIVAYDTVGHKLLALLILRHLSSVADVAFRSEIGVQPALSQDDSYLLAIIGVVCLHSHVVDPRTNTEGCVRRQRPGRRGPGHEIWRAPLGPFFFRIDGLEECCHRSILHVTIAAGLIQLVAGESCTCGGRIRLDGVALIEQPFLIELLEQPPKGFDIFVVVRDIRMVEVYKVAHLLCQFTPLLSEHHHVLAAFLVVVFR